MKKAVFRAVVLIFILVRSAAGFPFETVEINSESTYSAAAVSDIDADGDLDIICGGYWYEAPSWTPHVVRKVEEIGGRFDGYSHLPIDMDGDGDDDFINVNYRSKSIYWIERPDDLTEEWPKHIVALPGAMENGSLVDVDGDGQVDLLPNGPGVAAWWKITNESENSNRKFLIRHDLIPELAGHGMGIGDVDSDGRMDLVGVSGWAKAPQERIGGTWEWNPEFELEQRASVPVLVVDVDQDGDTDIIWSSAHDYGVFWLEQSHDKHGKREWTRHEIDKSWSQGHTPHWVDLDGNGVNEFVCGKRYMAHEGKDPGAYDPLVIYSYEFEPKEAKWRRREISKGDKVGWGLSPAISDIDGDGDLDLICPGRSGLYLLLNQSQ